MAIKFTDVTLPPLSGFSADAPSGAVIGVVGDSESGTDALLRLAGGLEEPRQGSVTSGPIRRYIGVNDLLNLAPADVIAIDHGLARQDEIARTRAAIEFDRLRRAGTTILLSSHETALIRRYSDEVWWLRDGSLAAKGDPAEVLGQYECYLLEKIRAWGNSVKAPLEPALRRGDGRAEVVSIETLGADGRPTMIWRSGESVSVRVTVRFAQAVEDPVVGIMIRTRIGLEVYGTNTELEGVKLGRCAPGETRTVTFAFRCDLCPKEYTLTAASHDPDGVWHDWLEDAVAFTVADTRYTAGVANLRATVTVARS